MNINCIICSDIFIPSAEIYTTGCGHLFHYPCLAQWIERSKSCPQCRSRTTEKSVHRLFFNHVDTDGAQEDVSTLKFRLDNLKHEIRGKDLDIKNLKQKHEHDQFQNKELIKEVKNLEREMRAKESTLAAFKEQIIYFKGKSKGVDKLNEEINKLKQTMSSYDDMQVILSGTREEANEMLRHNRDPESLCVMVSALKKELMESNKNKKKTSQALKQKENEFIDLQHRFAEALKEADSLREKLRDHENCENTIRNLKKRIKDLQDEQTKQVFESPECSRRQLLNTSCFDIFSPKIESPSVLESVKKTLDSDSPYLPIKASSFGLSNLTGHLSYNTNKNTSKFSMFNKTEPTSNKFKNKDLVYDGMGGYTKEDKFPSPTKTGIKRPKSSSGVSVQKFKKLAPNKKLDEYLEQK